MRVRRECITLCALVVPLLLLSGCLNPEDADSDALPDDIERGGWQVHVTYPGEDYSVTVNVTSSTGKKDTDGDGLSDYDEWSASNGYITHPREADTDGDGLTDYEEIINFSSDPLHWADDIDSDNGWWKGDYQEILYYQSRGIDNHTIRYFLQDGDVDNDGVADGSDIDPLNNLKIEVAIKAIKITSDMDDTDEPIKIETVFNLTTDDDYASSDEFLIPIEYNYSTINLTWSLDLSDKGIPGGNNSISITVLDMDTDLDEKKPRDELIGQGGDGFAGMDFVKIDGNSSFVNNEFNVALDAHAYHLVGDDAEIWFEIEDVSIPWS
jgi:hypothetical protein